MDSEIKNSEKMRYDAEAFVNALAQMTDAKESDIRIKYGASGRIVYGQTSSKEFREELDEPKLIAMVDAMQQPTNASLSDYGKSKPVIEITVKNETVFRQERDGAVTINQVQLERDANLTAAVETSAKLQQQQATTPAKKLKFSDLKKEAKAAGLTLERHKTSGYCVYVAGTRNLVHEGDRLKKLTDVQNSIEEYREKTAASTIEESEVTTAQSDTVEYQVQPSELESINVQSEVINQSEMAASEISVQELQPELIQSEANFVQPDVSVTELETAEVSRSQLIEIDDKQYINSKADNTKLESLISQIKSEINLTTTNLPIPETNEQIRTYLEVEGDFWKNSGIDIGVQKGETAANLAVALKDLGIETDENYRTTLELANLEWQTSYAEDLVQNSTVGFQEIESGVTNNTLSNVLEKLQVPSVFACAAKQIEALPADNVRAVLTDWVGAVSQDVFEKINETVNHTKAFSDRLSEQFKDSADKAKSFGEILSEQFKNFQSKATEFKEKTDSFGQRTTEQLQTIKTWRAEQSVAETALRIYKHHHERMLKDSDYRQQHQGEFNTFKGQKYTITQKGRNFYELTSNDTKQTLMQFKEKPWRLEINQQRKNLQPEDYREFSVIKEKLNRLGLGEVQGIGQKHYGGMQPTGKESQHKRSQEGIALT
ncbi:hypothetical protein [Floridanema evergladense]|uniref:Large polyvalent protein-associated domain-containing protein n=1 Tax=Floridaenema evergladense BLCC-F167 TaxID=3153639 RepID=A0ABV4WGZ6_9CYAN